MNKEHSRTTGKDAQEVRPSTPFQATRPAIELISLGGVACWPRAYRVYMRADSRARDEAEGPCRMRTRSEQRTEPWWIAS
jgi:hypothetical protein